jgi:K(+)-stimulated pyrophosphate-energized sodium pump
VGMSVGEDANTTLRVSIALVATLVIVAAVVVSKRRSTVVGGESDAARDELTTRAA